MVGNDVEAAGEDLVLVRTLRQGRQAFGWN
jgi:hypothetical protein